MPCIAGVVYRRGGQTAVCPSCGRISNTLLHSVAVGSAVSGMAQLVESLFGVRFRFLDVVFGHEYVNAGVVCEDSGPFGVVTFALSLDEAPGIFGGAA